jgi:deoxyribonuclease-4
VIDAVREQLGPAALRDLHIHIAGIEYGEKGERRHLNLSASRLDYEALMAALKRRRVGGIVICESPNLEEDALLLKRTYEALR